MTQTLYLLRHAKAVPWHPGINDFERPLNDRGSSHMEQLSSWAADHLAMPDTVLCSTSERTRETLNPFLDCWPGLIERTQYLDEIYEATTGMLHELALQAFQSASSVMMVGHNPGFEYLTLAVLRDADANGISKMATGTLAAIEFSGGYEIECGDGHLSNWVTRKNFSSD